ncbi:pentatricopeptide repeat-containing protein At5g27110 [Cucurbita pepo subsp. pepo]|uniref:pentatricopeptide repeat-containing protein At5g27110 n=1 Tax=Cucurbita pepo subsp. pepo TaxID=3664 RepID=UPI000C9D96FD|nr:pentatricopeptide repeat-containing protein At5g27110 [Cucurbita pepo subsp. pepo]
MDYMTLLSALRTCASSKLLKQGKLIHQRIFCSGFQSNVTLCKALIGFYFSCYDYRSAELVFQTNDCPLDVSLWNALLSAYTKSSRFVEALQLFDQLKSHSHVRPDCYTYPVVLKACGGLGRVVYGRRIHNHLIKTGLIWDVFVGSSMMNMYAKCDQFHDAVNLFDEIPQRDVGCWNAVISCYFQDDKPEAALKMFDKMKELGFEPNSVTFTVVVSSCARLLNLGRGKEIHRELIDRSVLLDAFVLSALVDMYGKCGCLEMAKEVFEQIPRKNAMTWNSMITGYSLKGDSRSCIELLMRMNDEGTKPTLTTLTSIIYASSRSVQLRHGKFIHGYILRNRIDVDIFIDVSLIDLYFKCGSVSSAETVFRNVSKHEVVSWNVMISGYVMVGNHIQALRVYDNMKEHHVKPDAVTFSSTLSACSQLAALDKGRELHHCIISHKLECNEIVMGALLDMYAKCGDVNEARKLFHQLPERDLVSWTSMITAYGSHGQASEALRLFDEMQKSNVRADSVTFLAVLSACSHAGLVDEGYIYFNEMITQYDIRPGIEHYSCLIDLLGRAGRLHEAYEILERSEETRNDTGLLSTLFSACRLHNDFGLGIKIGKLLMEVHPDDPSTYILLSNMYASVNKWEEVRNLRRKMKELGLKKRPGCSWIEINQRIQPFFVEDKSNPAVDGVYECLSTLACHMEKNELEV